jgi:threonine dehydratase
MVIYSEIEKAAHLLKNVANPTPVLTSRTFNKRTEAEVFFKAENFQRMGAFKFRGAFNALSQLTEAQKAKGVLTFSSGNHAQAIALSGRILGIQTTVIMPSDAPQIKVEATRNYGAEVILYDKAETSREALANKMEAESGMTVIPPFDHPHVIAGQGTAAKELFEEVGELDMLFVCCGGGGLLSGCALAAKTLSPNCQVIGVEPEAGDDVTRSFYSKSIQSVHNPDTIADGARTPAPSQLTFDMIGRYVDTMLTVSDQDLARTMFWMWERMKIVVEPTGALATTGLLQGGLDIAGKRIGVIISGGNVDLQAVPMLLKIAE